MGFNPRLRAGGDASAEDRSAANECFNPRLRAGGDQTRCLKGHDASSVSIHASAREATITRSGDYQARYGFNPRLRAGGDGRSRTRHRDHSRFNPRLRAGGDRRQDTAPAVPGSFNPRLRAGGD